MKGKLNFPFYYWTEGAARAMPSLLGYCRDTTEVGKAKCSLFLKIVQTNGISFASNHFIHIRSSLSRVTILQFTVICHHWYLNCLLSMRYHGDRWVTDDFCCHRHRHQKSKRLHDDAIRHRGDANSKKRCFCAVSALFLNRLSPSRKSKLLIASMLSTDGDSDRCFATFFYSTFVSSNRLWFRSGCTPCKGKSP